MNGNPSSRLERDGGDGGDGGNDGIVKNGTTTEQRHVQEPFACFKLVRVGEVKSVEDTKAGIVLSDFDLPRRCRKQKNGSLGCSEICSMSKNTKKTEKERDVQLTC